MTEPPPTAFRSNSTLNVRPWRRTKLTNKQSTSFFQNWKINVKYANMKSGCQNDS